MNENLTVKNVLTMHDVSKQPLSTADYIKLAEKRLGPCIETAFGKLYSFVITSAILDDTSNTLKVEFILPMCFDNRHFVWYFNLLHLQKQKRQNGSACD